MKHAFEETVCERNHGAERCSEKDAERPIEDGEWYNGSLGGLKGKLVKTLKVMSSPGRETTGRVACEEERIRACHIKACEETWEKLQTRTSTKQTGRTGVMQVQIWLATDMRKEDEIAGRIVENAIVNQGAVQETDWVIDMGWELVSATGIGNEAGSTNLISVCQLTIKGINISFKKE
ncbi:hypothetical protein HOY80DRAFT_1040339 [Tuber brumale]|nr:hypothetical protein HOY80DRAFT_1040339 [Tuber brumale]